MYRSVLIMLAVLIVATIGVYAIYAREMTRAHARLTGRSKTIVTSFGMLEYAVMGEGEVRDRKGVLRVNYLRLCHALFYVLEFIMVVWSYSAAILLGPGYAPRGWAPPAPHVRLRLLSLLSLFSLSASQYSACLLACFLLFPLLTSEKCNTDIY